MKKKEKTSYRTMDIKELRSAIEQTRQKVLEATLERTYKQVKNTRSLKELKKKLAVGQTLLKEKELQAV